MIERNKVTNKGEDMSDKEKELYICDHAEG